MKSDASVDLDVLEPCVLEEGPSARQNLVSKQALSCVPCRGSALCPGWASEVGTGQELVRLGMGDEGPASVYSHCSNKISLRSVYKNRNAFLTVLEARRSRLWKIQCQVRAWSLVP
jgi:hypothetical protein